MRLNHFQAVNFRNMESVRLEAGPRFNLLYGCNGQGKTNLLEAVYLLGNPRSFRHSRLPEYIRHGQPQARVSGIVESAGIVSCIDLTLESAGRRVEIDGKGVRRASELHGRLTAVVFSPDDTGMVKSGPEARRRFLDRAVYTGDIGYLHCWHDYHRTLKQRNQLLKSQDREGLEVWTEKLAESGAEVIERRRTYVSQLETQLQNHYAAISGGAESAGISYRPEGVPDAGKNALREGLLELFNRHAKSDERLGTTTAGPHRDDLHFSLDNRALKSFGSQGQQKSYVLALKMAEMENLERIFGEPPLLLLDDMSSELDAGRSGNLMDYLVARDIQVFITTTDPSSLRGSAACCSVFRVENGNLMFEG